MPTEPGRTEAPVTAPVTAIIPAAGLGTRLMPISSAIPKAMVPVAGQPLISITVNHLSRLGIRRFVIVTGHHGDQLRDYLQRVYAGASFSIEFVEQEVLDGPLGAVRRGQEVAGDGPLLIHLGDTLTRDTLEFDRDFVLGHDVDESWRWCMAARDAYGALTELYDKPEENKPGAQALIGVYFFRDGALWRRCTEDVYREGATIRGEYQLSSAIERYNRVRPVEVREAHDWFDCGSIDRYVVTRREIIQSRQLNNVWVDDLGVLHKRSMASDHLRDEINWYRNVPPSVAPLLPRVFSYSLEPEDTALALEYVPVPTLSEIYLYANVHSDVWDYALNRVLTLWSRVFLDEKAGRASTVSRTFASRTFEMYWEKTERRLSEAVDVIPFQSSAVRVNGTLLPSWDELRPLVRDAIDRVARNPRWTLLHGDLHFGNMLFDFNSGQLKLIDPRGAFGEAGCYGDARYDLAKLLHSFHGGYAHLAAGMFELSGEGRSYELRLFGGADREHLYGCFERWVTQAGFDMREICLIEGLLFLSLVPFHADDRKRQVAAYLTGIELVTAALERMRAHAGVR